MNLVPVISVLILGIVFGHVSGLTEYEQRVFNTPIPANFTIGWYNQKVDHFGYANRDTFKQRYIVSTDHWSPGCPIFFYAGNEGDIFMFANNTGFMWENAAPFKAMVLFAEHRYYGESMPYGKKSYEVGFRLD